MNESVVRHYVEVARREWWVVLQAVVIVALVAGFIAHRNESSDYRADAQLYVEAAVGPDGSLPLVVDPSLPATNGAATLSAPLAVALGREASSPDVLTGAAKALGTTAGSLGATVTTSVNAASRTVTITATAASPSRATMVANAMGQSYVNFRWTRREAALRTQIDLTSNQLADIQAQITRLNAEENTAKLQNRDTSSFETTKTVVLTQYQTALSNQQLLQGSLQARDNGVPFLLPAQSSARVASATPLTRGLEGAAIGLIIGIGLAALRETLDAKIRDRNWVEEATGLQTIGELPKDRHLRKQPLGIVDSPASLYAELVRALRGSLTWAIDRGESVSITVTSPQSGDGKTTVATNLAAAFALSGARTVFVSADFRSPTFHRELFLRRQSFGDRPARGFAEILLDDESDLPDIDALRDSLIETRVENLLWLPATVTNSSTAALATRAAERLTSGRARRLLVALSELCDLIVIDTPPALLAESASLNALADGVVLVVRPDRTRRAALERTIRSWKSSPTTPLGVVLNGTRPAREDTLSSTAASAWRSRRRSHARVRGRVRQGFGARPSRRPPTARTAARVRCPAQRSLPSRRRRRAVRSGGLRGAGYRVSALTCWSSPPPATLALAVPEYASSSSMTAGPHQGCCDTLGPVVAQK